MTLAEPHHPARAPDLFLATTTTRLSTHVYASHHGLRNSSRHPGSISPKPGRPQHIGKHAIPGCQHRHAQLGTRPDPGPRSRAKLEGCVPGPNLQHLSCRGTGGQGQDYTLAATESRRECEESLDGRIGEHAGVWRSGYHRSLLEGYVLELAHELSNGSG